jgi:hypothetical protein
LRHLFVAAAIITTSLAFGAAPPATPIGSGMAPHYGTKSGWGE